jgi:penicillin-binding protein 1B
MPKSTTTKKRPSRSKRKKSSKGNAGNSFLKRVVKRLLLWSFVVLTFLFLTYLGYQDYTVRELFEGKRWSLPAHVYASPLELYSGYAISANELEKILEALHYREDARLSSEATYIRSGSRVTLRTRHFRFWDGEQASQQRRLLFSGNRLERIEPVAGAEPIALLRLDPIQIGSFYPALKEDRILVQLQQVPKPLIQALLATEDRDFYHHHGISVKAVLRALLANIRAGGIVQGGSTITQQLVKNFYLTSERSLWRKINEAFIALILEARYNKDEILEAYLNEIYLGQDGVRAIHGFGLASQYYFSRSLDELKLPHLALLVALVRGPNHYDPRRWPDRALKRRNHVLDAMEAQGYVSRKQADAAKRQPLDISRDGHWASSRYPAFLDLARRQLRKEYRDKDLTSAGLKIFTTLDIRVQRALESTVTGTVQRLEKRRGVDKLETASIVTRREGGEIVALVGGRHPRQAGYNRALDAVRQIGSLIKPVVYLTALEDPDRYTVTTRLNDTAVRLKSGGKIWAPKNYDHEEHGAVPLHTALARSLNLATVHLGMDIGIARTAKTLRSMGVSRPLELYPSLLLGAAALSPLEVTQLYQTLAGDGFATPLRSIQAVIARDGAPLQRYPLTVRQAVDPAATYITNTILQEVMRSGTGRSVYSVIPRNLNVAGKTGSTDNLRDSWVAGFSGDYLAVVWVGRDDNKPARLTGSSGALKIWGAVMKKISRQPVDLIPPEEIEMVWIDPATSLRAGAACPGAVRYPYIKGSAPQQYAPCARARQNRTRSWFSDW